MYKITNYTKRQAKKLNVDVKPSTRKNKKLDVYKNGVYIVSVGDSRYSDYPTYIKTHGINYANERRRLYKARHEKTRGVVGSASWYADKLLW
jgi:hypothetical protein